jgi:hypothetical protein
MGDRVNIPLVYGRSFEYVKAERLGTGADGCELHRVWRPPLLPGGAERVDVLRLLPQEGPGFDFVGSADPARPYATDVTIPLSCLGTPACDAFRRKLDEHGCVLEYEYYDPDAIWLVFSHPAEAAVTEWHGAMLREAIGVPPDELREYMHDEALTRKRESARRRSHESRRRWWSSRAREAVALSRFIVMLGIIAGIVAVVRMGLPADAHRDIPTLAATGMLVALTPMLLTRDGRGMLPLIAICAAAGAAVLMLLGSSPPAYGAAAAVGTVYALLVGAFAVLIAIFSGFATSTGEMLRVVGGVALPMLASALAAAAVALASATASGRTGGVSAGGRTVAIALTALLLLAPVMTMVTNAMAVFGNKAWRAMPGTSLLMLATIPLSMVRVLFFRVGIPIAVIWGMVWLLRLV